MRKEGTDRRSAISEKNREGGSKIVQGKSLEGKGEEGLYKST